MSDLSEGVKCVICDQEPASPQEGKPRQPLWERLLDPHTIQCLLGLGGALFVLGLVIWLTLPEKVQRREGLFRILTWR